MTTLYFAYGSNLLCERLLAHCQGLAHAGRAVLPGYRLTLDMASLDGSSKAAFAPADDDAVQGVLWHLPESELANLDQAEGAGEGYKRCMVEAVQTDGTTVEAMTYRATKRWANVPPYDWYLALMIAGAQQQDLPATYIERLRVIPFGVDTDTSRQTRREALRVLEQAGLIDALHALGQKPGQ